MTRELSLLQRGLTSLPQLLVGKRLTSLPQLPMDKRLTNLTNQLQLPMDCKQAKLKLMEHLPRMS